jgi:hypothetical protein
MRTDILRISLAAFLGAWAVENAAFALERLEPAKGCYLGFSLGETDRVSRLNSKLGITPAVYHRFFVFPINTYDGVSLTNFLNEVILNGGIAMLTLEPRAGLDAITEAVCADMGTLCAAYEQLGVDGVIIRFGHEMNGNWYQWGQQPILYKEKFRLLAQHIHSRTTRTALLWAPSYGFGYPFGTPRAKRGSGDFAALDTNGDGEVTLEDDMYEPYYPGDDAVDWVGLTIYHWGVDYPWFENELPVAKSFADSLTGTYLGVIPNFYARYCADGLHNKPMAIPETAAFYNTQTGGEDEFNLKQAWWRQVFNITGDTSSALDVALHFPKMKSVVWFDQYKPEGEAKNSWIDWRVSADQRIRAAFVEDVRRLRDGRFYFLTAQEARWQLSAYAVTAPWLPQILPLTGSLSFSLNAKTKAPCDLVVDLLDANFQWHGGTRKPITATTQTVTVTFPLVGTLRDGALYRWNIFLTPTGSNFQHALAWYKGPQPVARVFNSAIQILAFPPVLQSPSNFTVRIKYVAAKYAVAVVNILDDASRRVGGGSAIVRKGDGQRDVPIDLSMGMPKGKVWLEALLTDSPTNSLMPMARSEKTPLLAGSVVDQDFIKAVAEPSLVPVDEVLRFPVGYAAITNRDLHIDLFDANTNYLASAFQSVAPGSGVQDMTISYPNATPGEYFITVFMTPSGQSWEQAVAWGSEQRITIIAASYQEWIESYWGVVLQNDPVGPQDDPDGDGVSNAEEFLAQTDPRNAEVRLKIARGATGLVVSWPSIAGRTYQLLESSSATAGLWTMIGGPSIGTGTAVDVAVTPKGISSFYRVQLVK